METSLLQEAAPGHHQLQPQALGENKAAPELPWHWNGCGMGAHGNGKEGAQLAAANPTQHPPLLIFLTLRSDYTPKFTSAKTVVQQSTQAVFILNLDEVSKKAVQI